VQTTKLDGRSQLRRSDAPAAMCYKNLEGAAGAINEEQG
jgi:hypothetical protein